jgi:hypothetical protein
MWWLLGSGAVAALGYAALVAIARLRYGHPPTAPKMFVDPMLDRFFPRYDIVERHHVRINAPAAIVYDAARDMDLRQSAIASAIFETRGLALGAERQARPALGLLAEMVQLGWGVLEERPGREIVLGAICRPWEANVHFQPLAPDVFAAFCEPGYVKIAWTLRADPLPDGSTRFVTETRAVGTDPVARRRFRTYWSFVAPGVALIRRLMLRPVKREAERRWASHHSRQCA